MFAEKLAEIGERVAPSEAVYSVEQVSVWAALEGVVVNDTNLSLDSSCHRAKNWIQWHYYFMMYAKKLFSVIMMGPLQV